MKNHTHILELALALALGLAGAAAQAGLVSFDPVDEQGLTLDAGDAIGAQGFRFTQGNAAPATLFAGDLVGAYASNGSASLYAANAADIVLTLAGGGRFDLASLEVGGGNLGDIASWAIELLLTGLTADNTMLNGSVLLDPGSSGLASVPLGWSNLTELRLHVAAGDYSIDNLDLRALPEPASWAMLGAGLAALLAARRRRRAGAG